MHLPSQLLAGDPVQLDGTAGCGMPATAVSVSAAYNIRPYGLLGVGLLSYVESGRPCRTFFSHPAWHMKTHSRHTVVVLMSSSLCNSCRKTTEPREALHPGLRGKIAEVQTSGFCEKSPELVLHSLSARCVRSSLAAFGR